MSIWDVRKELHSLGWWVQDELIPHEFFVKPAERKQENASKFTYFIEISRMNWHGKRLEKEICYKLDTHEVLKIEEIIFAILNLAKEAYNDFPDHPPILKNGKLIGVKTYASI